MAPIAALWTRIIYVFDFLTFSRHPLPVPGSQLDLQIPVHTVQPARPQVTKYPVFNPPDDLEDTPFRCEYPDYPEKDGWISCNTNRDRGYWLKNTKTGQRFDIKTDYEISGPKGIAREYYLELSESTLTPDGNVTLPVQLFQQHTTWTSTPSMLGRPCEHHDQEQATVQ